MRWLLGALTLISGDRSVRVLVVFWLSGVRLWSRFVFHGDVGWLLSFSFVRSWLNLSLARSSVNILRAACCPVLIYLFVLLVWSWWQLHIITDLLGFGRVGIWKTLQLSIVLDNLIAEEHFIDDFVIRSWVLEERIVHVASSGWVDSQVVLSSLIFQDGFLDVFFIFQVCSLFQWLVEGRILLGVFTDKFIDLLH